MAGGIDWFRWHHGSVTDPKFQLVARKSKQALASVIAVWAFVLEQASASEDRGAFGTIDCEAIDCLLGLEDGATAAILAAMGERGLVDDGTVSAWEKRQPKRERTDNTSTERSRAHRDRQRQSQQDGETQHHATPEIDDATPCNATQHQKKPRGEESREEKKNTPQPPTGAFEAFWECWPQNERKQDKAKCSEKWKRDSLDTVAAAIVADVSAKKHSQKWRDGFIEAPMVYLNNRRWEDGAAGAATGPKRGTDEYAALHKTAGWWREAGFDTVWDAMASKCWHTNAHQFRDGKRVEVAA